MIEPEASPQYVPGVAPNGAGDVFLEKVYQELRQLASARMSQESAPQTLQPTALVHEAWLRLGGGAESWENTSHFFSAAAQAMRRILIERARRHTRLKRGAGQPHFDLQGFDLAEATVDERVLLINDALERLQAADADKARIVELKYFGGLTNAEIGQLLNLSERTVERQWAFAKSWLYAAIEDLAGSNA